jgi:flagellar biosynthesis protein FliQ
MLLHKMLKAVSLRLMAMAMAMSCPDLNFVPKVCKVAIQSFVCGRWVVNFALHYWLFFYFHFCFVLAAVLPCPF